MWAEISLISYFCLGGPRIRGGIMRDVPPTHIRTTTNNNSLCIPHQQIWTLRPARILPRRCYVRRCHYSFNTCSMAKTR